MNIKLKYYISAFWKDAKISLYNRCIWLEQRLAWQGAWTMALYTYLINSDIVMKRKFKSIEKNTNSFSHFYIKMTTVTPYSSLNQDVNSSMMLWLKVQPEFQKSWIMIKAANSDAPTCRHQSHITGTHNWAVERVLPPGHAVDRLNAGDLSLFISLPAHRHFPYQVKYLLFTHYTFWCSFVILTNKRNC